jgi:hypothetical protein
MNVSNVLSPRINIDSYTVENLTWYISRIDPVTLKIIPGEYEGRIDPRIKTLEKLKFL